MPKQCSHCKNPIGAIENYGSDDIPLCFDCSKTRSDPGPVRECGNSVACAPPAEEPMKERFSSDLRQALTPKFLITLSLIAFAIAGYFVALPGIDRTILYEFLGQTHKHLGQHMSIFGLGINPYLFGTELILILSGLVPFLRRWREGDHYQTALFDKMIYFGTVIPAVIQAIGISIFLRSINSPGTGEPLVTGNPQQFTITTVCFLTLGALAFAWVAEKISTYGIINGIAVMALFFHLDNFFGVIYGKYASIEQGHEFGTGDMLTVGSVAALVAASIWFIKAGKEIRLQPADIPGTGEVTSAAEVRMPLRINIVGLFPIWSAGSVCYILMTCKLLESDMFSYWIAYSAVTVAGTVFFTKVNSNPKHIGDTLRRYGYRIAQLPKDATTEQYMSRESMKTIFPAGAFLVLVSLLPAAFALRLGIKTDLLSLFSPAIVILCAIALELKRKLAIEAELFRKTGNDRSGKWVAVCDCETELEGDLLVAVLHRHGIDSVKYCNRAICLAGSLGIWEICRPAYPAFSWYRGLGKGKIELLVSPEQRERAIPILQRYENRCV